jgi:hypothetical protein
LLLLLLLARWGAPIGHHCTTSSSSSSSHIACGLLNHWISCWGSWPLQQQLLQLLLLLQALFPVAIIIHHLALAHKVGHFRNGPC